jgi:hypothetical protein
MGILPDWLGEGGFIAVAANPPPNPQGASYARRPTSVRELSFQVATVYPARVADLGYEVVRRVASPGSVSYQDTIKFPSNISTAQYSGGQLRPPQVQNLSYQ